MGRAKHKSSGQLREVCRQLVAEKVQQVLAKPGDLSADVVKSAIADDLANPSSWSSHPSPESASHSPGFGHSPNTSFGLHLPVMSPLGDQHPHHAMATASLVPGLQASAPMPHHAVITSPMSPATLPLHGHTLPAAAGQVLMASLPQP